MKTLILTVALGLTISGTTALAYESRHEESRHEEYRGGHAGRGRESLDRHINHLNRMLQHVRWQVRHYRADWQIRREIEQTSREVDRVNRRFRNNDYNGGRLRGEVERLHDRLHGIEQRLHVRSRDFYRWD
jgi:predicted RNase H-like nuclease (RuvC/YqgF family)